MEVGFLVWVCCKFSCIVRGFYRSLYSRSKVYFVKVLGGFGDLKFFEDIVFRDWNFKKLFFGFNDMN